MFNGDKMQNKIVRCKTMEEAFNIIKSYPLIGNFMAYQLVTDINYKEKVKFLCNKSVASINIKMDFNDYYNADSIKRIELTKEMILTAVKRIITKVDFDYGKFKEDLISLH